MQIGRLSELGPRSVWDILDDAFDLYRERWVLLCGATAIVYVPLYSLYFALIAGPTGRFARSTEATSDTSVLLGAMGPMLGTMLLLYPIVLIAQVLQTGLVSVIVRDVLSERVITSYKGAFALVSRRIWPLLLGAIAYAVAVWVGLFGFFVGAAYVATLLAFVPQLVVLEGRGIADAFRRSQTLVRPDWGRVLGLWLLVGTVSLLLQLGLEGIIEIVYSLLPKAGDAGVREAQKELMGEAFSSVVTLLLAPIGAIAFTLLYYDLRVRREGFDLVAQAQAMNYPLAPDPFGDVSSEEARERERRDRLRTDRRARKGR